VVQGDVTYMEKMIESLVVEFDQAKYEEYLSFGSKSPRTRQYRKVSSGTRSQVRSEIPSDATGKKSAMANRITRNARVNVSHETHKVSVADVPIHARPLPQLQVTGGSQQPVWRNRSIKCRQRQARVNYKRKKLEQPYVQQIQNARLQPASILSYVRCMKSAYGDQNTKPNRLAFLRLHFPNTTFNSVRSVLLLRDTRPASLQPNAELRKYACLDRR